MNVPLEHMTPTELLYEREFSVYATEMHLTAAQLRKLIREDEVTMEDFTALIELKASTVEGIYKFLYREEIQYLDDCRTELKELKEFEKETNFLGAQGGHMELERGVIDANKKRLMKTLGIEYNGE